MKDVRKRVFRNQKCLGKGCAGQATRAWLAANGIQFGELIMYPASRPEDRHDVGLWKGETYKHSNLENPNDVVMGFAGADLIADSEYAVFYELFLDHGKVAAQHYKKSGKINEQFDAAVLWLESKLGL